MSNNPVDPQKPNTSQKPEKPPEPPKPPKGEPIKFEKTVHLRNDGARS